MGIVALLLTVRSSWPEATSYTLMLVRSAMIARAPSLLNATVRGPSESKPEIVRASWPLATSHTFAVSSMPPEMM